jgi:hypothetical protein
MTEPYLTREELAEGQEKFRERLEAMSDTEFAAFQETFRKNCIERDAKGRFRKDAPSPNPHGPKPKERRRFGKTQTAKDLLELLEQPVTVTKNDKKQKVPAIVAIYDRMIHMAVNGDWQAMRKCVELREKYSEYREQVLGQLLERAGAIRLSYEGAEDQMPEDLKQLVEFIERNVAEGEFRAA